MVPALRCTLPALQPQPRPALAGGNGDAETQVLLAAADALLRKRQHYRRVPAKPSLLYSAAHKVWAPLHIAAAAASYGGLCHPRHYMYMFLVLLLLYLTLAYTAARAPATYPAALPNCPIWSSTVVL